MSTIFSAVDFISESMALSRAPILKGLLELEFFVGVDVGAARGVEDSIRGFFTLVVLDAVLVIVVAPQSLVLEVL